jgi:hypothetical protein
LELKSVRGEWGKLHDEAHSYTHHNILFGVMKPEEWDSQDM